MNRNTGEHVYYEFKNPDTGKTVQDYMNKWEWEAIQRSPRRVNYTLLKEINVNTGKTVDTPEAKETKSSAPEVVEDPFECPLCGYIAIDDADLQSHKNKKHL